VAPSAMPAHFVIGSRAVRKWSLGPVSIRFSIEPEGEGIAILLLNWSFFRPDRTTEFASDCAPSSKSQSRKPLGQGSYIEADFSDLGSCALDSHQTILPEICHKLVDGNFWIATSHPVTRRFRHDQRLPTKVD